jgi:hypothetical protein
MHLRTAGRRDIGGFTVTDGIEVVPMISLGRADWIYDDEIGCHIPCCAMYIGNQRCGNNPLKGDQIRTGNCGNKHVPVSGKFGTVVYSKSISGGQTMKDSL